MNQNTGSMTEVEVTPIEATEELLPRRIRDLLEACPPPGKGVHLWLPKVAVRLHAYYENKERIAELLEKYSTRRLRQNEAWNAINSTDKWLAKQKEKPVSVQESERAPEPDAREIADILRNGPNLEQLTASSPVRWTDAGPHTEEVIDILFPGNPLICAHLEKERALTRTREKWRGFLANQQFIVPSPMSAVYGITQNGKRSMHCLANTGPRRFLVVESDVGTFDDQAALLTHFAQSGPFPLVMVVHSANKSLHGWYFCAGQPEETVRKVFDCAVSIGADAATWTRCQYVRMPDGKRDNGARQRIVYFNPQPLQAH